MQTMVPTLLPPSFKYYDDKEKYKFREYSLEDFICQSRSTAFRDNYFADLYNLIVKEKPNLKEKAQKIARERITKTQKECIAPRSKKFKQNCKLTFSILVLFIVLGHIIEAIRLSLH